MILPEALAGILRLLPPPLAPLLLPGRPDLSAAAPLAACFGADAHRLIDRAEDVQAEAAGLDRLHAQGAALVDRARILFVDLIGQLLRDSAAALTAPPLNAVPARLEALGSSYLKLAGEIGERLSGELAALGEDTTRMPARQTHQRTHPAAEAPAAEPPSSPPEAEGGDTPDGPGAAAVAAAQSVIGAPYAWGGTSPAGFDCSGLTQWAWAQAGVDLPRTAEQQAVGRAVTAEELIPGDLVVWDGHVAMYAGDGQIIEAGDPVQTNPLRTNNMGMQFKGFYRPTG